MRFESQWFGAPFCPAYAREDGFFKAADREARNEAQRGETGCAETGRAETGRAETGCAETGRADFAGRRTGTNSSVSVLAALWSRILRGRRTRRLRAAWTAIDDRTLKDIGISRHDIEWTKDARHWRW